MTLPVSFANAEAMAVAFLDPAFVVPVRTTVPDPRPAKFVTVRRQGGVAVNPVTDGALLTVEAWAEDEYDAEALLQAVRRKLHEWPYATQGPHAVYRVIEVGGPANLPDPDSEQPRYTMLVQVLIRGLT